MALVEQREYPEVGVQKPTMPSAEDVQFRERIGEIITELVFDAQEVGFELATLKCDKINECPLVQKTRNLILKVKELFEIQRELTRKRTRKTPSSVSYA